MLSLCRACLVFVCFIIARFLSLVCRVLLISPFLIHIITSMILIIIIHMSVSCVLFFRLI